MPALPSTGGRTLRTRALGMDPWWLAGAHLVACADRVLVILKWFPLVRALTPAVRFGAAARTYLAAMFASLVLPPYLGNDVVRAVALGRRERVIAEVGTPVVVERVLGLVTLGLLCLVVAFYWMAAQALGVPADGRAVVAAVPLACFMARLPIGIWGLGIMEGSLVYLMRLFGVSPADALATALVGRLVELGSILPGGLFLGELTPIVRGGGEPTEAGRAPHALDRLSARRT